MKISKLFHYLYAAIMFLPLLLLPVFMIYSHRHTIDSGSIVVPQNQVVDFNQLSVINDFEYTAQEEGSVFTLNSSVDFQVDNVYLIQVSQSSTYSSVSRNIPILQYNFNLTPISDYFTLVSGDLSVSTIENVNLTSGSHYVYLKASSSFTASLLYWVNDGDVDNNYYHVNFYNLTQMFGSGNEPTYNQFLQFYPLKDYSYTLSRKELVKNYSTIQYNDTDIMSQAIYQLYNAFDKYFNMRRVFNLDSLYLWFSMTFFNGASPVAFVIIFNLFIYWLFVSLLWLLFDFFMYIPLVIHNGIDKARIE